ncbi:primosomal protein N' [Liquorilactobacillus sicerae]|uniref:primosomal protein N' n=1 Tax=Liquorilactobacillus sicerae TaxID=1416943 RepID=UPI0024815D6A|nr:primosomal protein N' [Liquorilactobacillus sicerae]
MHLQLAAVIVDVPARQTDRPFTYLIAENLRDSILPGMRVVVPFGRADRLIQGFVVQVFSVKAVPTKLKAIYAVQDIEPVLNNEMLELAQWLAARTFSFQIACFQAMLPNALRGKTKKQLVVTATDQLAPEIVEFMAGEQAKIIDTKQLPVELLKKIRQEKKAGKIEVRYLVQATAKPRQTKIIIGQLTRTQALEQKQRQRSNAVQRLRLLAFLAEHYQQAISKSGLEKKLDLSAATLKTAANQGWLKIQERPLRRETYDLAEITPTQPKKLSAEQATAYKQVATAVESQAATTFLLEGVTGSGKTEVYLQLIESALEQQRSALLLVPEISLTPQMVAQVVGRFGNQVALLHSGLSVGERLDEWRRIENDQAKVVVGARSAIFAPIKNLGIIIIDEEHESSYQQDNMPRYHARDVALWRSKFHHCPVVLGSATPSLESRARAQKKVYHWLRLTQRINTKPLPEVSLIDMRQATKISRDPDFSPQLIAAVKQKLQQKEQIILLLNRRGYASFVMCRDCGFVLKCPNCDITLTLHKDQQVMKCHYCGHEEAIPHTCPACGGQKIRYYGTGTQKVQEKLIKYFPTSRILRMDVDTTRRKGAHEKILAAFGAHQADILLGTQMIAKGLDYPDVTLVGVLNADTSLSLPDFRASEQTFQLLTQVSGRAGRAQKEGKVIIQTFNPQHYALQLAKKQDYERFYAFEMQLRHQSGYPPYYFTIQIAASAITEKIAFKALLQVAAELKTVLSPAAKILGPVPQMILKIKNRYRYQLIIKYKHEGKLNQYLRTLLEKSQRQTDLQLDIVREPHNFI